MRYDAIKTKLSGIYNTSVFQEVVKQHYHHLCLFWNDTLKYMVWIKMQIKGRLKGIQTVFQKVEKQHYHYLCYMGLPKWTLQSIENWKCYMLDMLDFRLISLDRITYVDVFGPLLQHAGTIWLCWFSSIIWTNHCVGLRWCICEYIVCFYVFILYLRSTLVLKYKM